MRLRRDLAKGLGVDPYAANPVPAKKLEDAAWVISSRSSRRPSAPRRWGASEAKRESTCREALHAPYHGGPRWTELANVSLPKHHEQAPAALILKEAAAG